MARVATAGELVKFRKEGQWAKLYAAIFVPHTIYTALINQTFTTTDGILELTYDAGSGTLADVLPGMTLLIGSSAGKWDIGIVRIRDKDATKFYIGETTDVNFANNQHLTVIDDFGLWARHVVITGGIPYMDGGVAYSDQHTDFDPVPIMGSHRVLKLTGATVATTLSAAGSYCLDSTISAYSWSAPGASATSGMTTSTPTVTYNATGWYYVSLTVTAINGKSFFGVRYIYVWNEANPPHRVEFGDFSADADSGGWQFDITSYSVIDIDTVMNNPLVIVFAEDYYGKLEADKGSIGPLEGSENIVVTGWIARETIEVDIKMNSMQFTGYTAQHWFQQIPSFPDGVRFITGTSAAWTDIKNLTLNKGLFHFIHWRTTATRIMDVFLTDDTNYTREVSSLATSLWEQLREMGWAQVYARAGMNCYNQLYIEVHPQLVPQASRTWPTVMTIEKQDYVSPLSFERAIINEVSKVYLSGVSVNSSGVGTPYFSLSPGHGYPHYGKPEIQDTLLLSSQAQANTLAGLYYSWKNNQFKDLPFVLKANNRLIDCFPRQKCTVTIDDGDNLRGIEYSGGLIPTSVTRTYEAKNGYLHTEVTFEGETFAGIAVNGDVPGSDDTSVIPSPSFPPLPDFEFSLPGLTPVTAEGAQAVILNDAGYGLLYSEDFNEAGPHWQTINSGLTPTQFQNINYFFVTPSGALYAAWVEAVDSGNYPSKQFFLARAPSIGATFEIIFTEADIRPSPITGNWGLFAVGYNPLLPDTVGIVMGVTNVDRRFWLGTGGSFVAGAITDVTAFWIGSVTFGMNSWLFTRTNHWERISVNGASVVATGSPGIEPLSVFNPYLGHVAASSTGRTFHKTGTGTELVVAEGNFASLVVKTLAASLSGDGFAVDPSGTYMMGRYDTGARGRSSDVGTTWSTMGSLPFGNWWWDYAGGAGVESRWVAAGGSSVRYSDDFGVTWINKEGHLSAVAPLPNIKGVKVITY